MGLDSDLYFANVTDSGTLVADIKVIAYQSPNSTNVPVSIQIAQLGSTEIDSIQIQFYMSGTYVTAYMDALQPQWPQTNFYRSEDATRVMFSVDDLGSVYGVGTVTRNFIFVRNNPSAFSGSLSLNLEFSMHQKSFLQLTSLKVQTFADITL